MTDERIRQLNDDIYNALRTHDNDIAKVDILTLETINGSLSTLIREKKETEIRDKLLKAVAELQAICKAHPTAEMNIDVHCSDGFYNTINILDYVEEIHIHC